MMSLSARQSESQFLCGARPHTIILRPVTHQPDRRSGPQKRRRARRISLAARLDRWGHDELRCKKKNYVNELSHTIFFNFPHPNRLALAWGAD